MRLTDDIDEIRITHEAAGVVLEDVGGLEDALYRASLHIELVVAEAISP